MTGSRQDQTRLPGGEIRYSAIVPPVATARSPEIESVSRRILRAWSAADYETIANLFSHDATLRVLGFDRGEWWAGPDEFLKVWRAQADEMPVWDIEIGDVEAFEDGSLGWACIFTTLVTPETRSPMRHTAVFKLESGAWHVIQWHNSIPTGNQRIFGVELTRTLDNLVTSVLDDAAQLTPSAGSEGTMTLVFTDIVDSTLHAGSIGDLPWAETMARHESTVQRVTAAHGGMVVKFLGDGSMLAFESARAAVRAAVELQRACEGEPFVVRIGIHTGEVVRTADDLFGLTVNKAARVAMAADGGGIMVSSTTRDLVGSLDGVAMGESQMVALKGLADTHQIVPVSWE